MSSAPRHPHCDSESHVQDDSVELLLSDYFERARTAQSNHQPMSDQVSHPDFNEMWRAARDLSSSQRDTQRDTQRDIQRDIQREKRHVMRWSFFESRGLSQSFPALSLVSLVGLISLVSLVTLTHAPQTRSNHPHNAQLNERFTPSSPRAHSPARPLYSLNTAQHTHRSHHLQDQRPQERRSQEYHPQEYHLQESSFQDSLTWSDGWLESDEWSISDSAHSSL